MKKPNLSRIPKKGLVLAILLIVSSGYNYAFSREHLATAKMEEARKQKDNLTIPEIIIMPALPQKAPLVPETVKYVLEREIAKELDETTDIWHYYAQHLYNFDATGNNIRSIYQIYDDSTAQWVNHEKNESTFDAERNMLSELIFMWDDSSASWIENYSGVNSYDASGNMTERLIYYVNEDTLELSGRIRFEYDSSGRLLERYDDYMTDSTGIWENSAKAVYSYDSNGNNTGYIQYYWYDGTWDPSHQIEIKFDDQNRNVEEIYSYWDGSAWSSTSRYTSAYGESPLPLEKISYYWDSYSTHDWVIGQRDTFVYDLKNNPVLTLSSNWDSEWIDFWKSEAVFDTSYSRNELFLPAWLSDMPIVDASMRLNDYHYGMREGSWKKLYENDFIYSSACTTGVRVVQTAPFKLYPNPARNVLYMNPGDISAYSVEMFDLAGRRIMSHQKFGISELSLQNLPRGVYLLRLTQNGRLPQTQRIILK